MNYYSYQQKEAVKRGLPKSASWATIYTYDGEQQRQAQASFLELPHDTPWGTIEIFLSERRRQREIHKLQLHQTASWRKINAYKDSLTLPSAKQDKAHSTNNTHSFLNRWLGLRYLRAFFERVWQ